MKSALSIAIVGLFHSSSNNSASALHLKGRIRFMDGVDDTNPDGTADEAPAP